MQRMSGGETLRNPRFADPCEDGLVTDVIGQISADLFVEGVDGVAQRFIGEHKELADLPTERIGLGAVGAASAEAVRQGRGASPLPLASEAPEGRAMKVQTLTGFAERQSSVEELQKDIFSIIRVHKLKTPAGRTGYNSYVPYSCCIL
jgi:hypothetical protein